MNIRRTEDQTYAIAGKGRKEIASHLNCIVDVPATVDYVEVVEEGTAEDCLLNGLGKGIGFVVKLKLKAYCTGLTRLRKLVDRNSIHFQPLTRMLVVLVATDILHKVGGTLVGIVEMDQANCTENRGVEKSILVDMVPIATVDALVNTVELLLQLGDLLKDLSTAGKEPLKPLIVPWIEGCLDWHSSHPHQGESSTPHDRSDRQASGCR